jgi:hypothetical protein
LTSWMVNYQLTVVYMRHAKVSNGPRLAAGQMNRTGHMSSQGQGHFIMCASLAYSEIDLVMR